MIYARIFVYRHIRSEWCNRRHDAMYVQNQPYSLQYLARCVEIIRRYLDFNINRTQENMHQLYRKSDGMLLRHQRIKIKN